jgi:hypothetical protein
MRIRGYAQKADQHPKHSKDESRGDGIDMRDCFEELADCAYQKRSAAYTDNLEDCLEEYFRDRCHYAGQKFVHRL